jgi:hypothetical protein
MTGPETDQAMAHINLPSPPFIHVPGLANLRDAGGYAIEGQPGKVIRRGVLYRSADLTKLEDEGVAVLRPLGITHVFDLRSVTELAKNGNRPPRTWEGAARVFVPVFLDKDYSPEALATRFRDYSDGPKVSRCAAWYTCMPKPLPPMSTAQVGYCGRGTVVTAGNPQGWLAGGVEGRHAGNQGKGANMHGMRCPHRCPRPSSTSHHHHPFRDSRAGFGLAHPHTFTPHTQRFPSCMSLTGTDG